MYHIIGLQRDGKLSLWSLEDGKPDLAELEKAIEEGGYTQLLVTESRCGQIARYEVHPSPVWQVDLA